MLYRPALMLIFLLLFTMSRLVQASAGPSVVFLSPGDSRFWSMVSEFMTEIATDLDLDFEVVLDPGSHRYTYLQVAEDVLERKNKPEYLVFMCKEHVTTRILTYASEMGVKVFTFNTDIPDATKAAVGMPRETLTNWIGHLAPDSAATGRTLTAILEQKSQRLGLIEPGQPLPLFALSGTLDSSAAKGRQQGLMETANANRTRLLQLVDAQWDRQLAKDKSLVLLKRYPQVAAIWSASDGMALGAIEAAKLAGRRPGKDVLVGGVDWEPEALESIRSGELAVSLGRHFMGGGLALLLLHDYHYGFDFSDDKSPPVLGYQLKPASLDNVDTVEQVMDPEHWQNVDFRRFSRRSDSGKPERRQSADELLDEFTRALTEAYPRSSSRLPVSVAADSSPDSVNR